MPRCPWQRTPRGYFADHAVLDRRPPAPGSCNDITGSRYGIVGSCKGIADSRDDIAGSCNDIAGSCNDIAGSRKGIVGSRNDIAGSRDDIAGSRDDIAGSCNDIAGSRNDIAGSCNDIVGSCNGIAGSCKGIVGSRNEIAGSRNDSPFLDGGHLFSSDGSLLLVHPQGWLAFRMTLRNFGRTRCRRRRGCQERSPGKGHSRAARGHARPSGPLAVLATSPRRMDAQMALCLVQRHRWLM